MEQSPFYFFSGENTYALREELHRWKQGFIAKHGSENLLVLQAKDLTVSDVLDAVATMPFIAEKRLVIIEGVPTMDKEEFQLVVENIHPQTILAIVEPKPDKRLSMTKELEKKAEAKVFELLTPKALENWIQSHARSVGSAIKTDAIKLLLSIVGNDQSMLDTEIRKLAAFSGPEITKEAIENVAVASGTQVVWRLTDLVGSKKNREALEFFWNRLERGEDAYALWSVLLNMIKNLVMVHAAMQSGLHDERSIMSASQVNFYAVRSLLPLSKSLTSTDIRALLEFATDADVQLKSGGYHYTVDRPEEVIALAEKAILMCKTSA